MPQPSSSIKTRIIAFTLLLVCGGAASFGYGILSNASLLVHSLLFGVAMLGGALLLWTVYSQMLQPLMLLGDYARSIAADKAAACPDGGMPAEYAELRDSLCRMVEHLEKALEAARQKEAEAESHAAELERTLNESRAAE